MRVRRFLHLILLLGVFGLLWQVWYTWSHSRTPPIAQPLEKPGTALPVLPVARVEAGRQFARVITEKNLFSPDRKTETEEPVEIEEKPTVPPPSHLKLVGVFLRDDKKEAFFQDASQGGKVVRVAAGDMLDSYHLARLTRSEATLTMGKGGQEVSMRIDVQKSQEAAKAPRLVPTRPQPASRTPDSPGQQEQTEQAEEGQPSIVSSTQILGGGGTPVPILGADSSQSAATGTGMEQASSDSSQDEALSIRQNIRQLQRRLREIRRQRARERRLEREQGRDR